MITFEDEVIAAYINGNDVSEIVRWFQTSATIEEIIDEYEQND